jgi:transposase
VVEAVERREGTIRQIAERFVVSVSFIVRLLQLRRRTGSVEPNPMAEAAAPP